MLFFTSTHTHTHTHTHILRQTWHWLPRWPPPPFFFPLSPPSPVLLSLPSPPPSLPLLSSRLLALCHSEQTHTHKNQVSNLLISLLWYLWGGGERCEARVQHVLKSQKIKLMCLITACWAPAAGLFGWWLVGWRWRWWWGNKAERAFSSKCLWSRVCVRERRKFFSSGLIPCWLVLGDGQEEIFELR